MYFDHSEGRFFSGSFLLYLFMPPSHWIISKKRFPIFLERLTKFLLILLILINSMLTSDLAITKNYGLKDLLLLWDNA